MSDLAPVELTPLELAGKAKRVVGVFVLMIGAGILLDTHAVWIGLPILAMGVVAFAWGMVETRSRETERAPIAEATESHL